MVDTKYLACIRTAKPMHLSGRGGVAEISRREVMSTNRAPTVVVPQEVRIHIALNLQCIIGEATLAGTWHTRRSAPLLDSFWQDAADAPQGEI